MLVVVEASCRVVVVVVWTKEEEVVVVTGLTPELTHPQNRTTKHIERVMNFFILRRTDYN